MNTKTKNKKINTFLNVFSENKKLLKNHNEIIELLFKISLLLNQKNNQAEIKIILDRFLFETLNNKY
jgi:hemerythrin